MPGSIAVSDAVFLVYCEYGDCVTYDWYYNQVRPYVTFLGALVGVHSDFRPIGVPIASPDGLLFVVPMANVSYARSDRGRLVTFDVRNARDEFVHHIQTDVPALGKWAIGWHDNATVIVRSISAGPEAFKVGESGMAYRMSEPYDDDLLKSIESLVLPSRKVWPTLTRHKSNRTRR